MKRWFGTMFQWLSTMSCRNGPAETNKMRLSDHERHLRQLDERAERLFLP
jgi:hypothetical protein